MPQDVAKTSIKINQLLCQLLDLYKINFMDDINSLATNTGSNTNVCQIFSSLNIFIEVLQKITAICSDYYNQHHTHQHLPTKQSNQIISWQQEFLQEHSQLYAATIKAKSSNIDNKYVSGNNENNNHSNLAHYNYLKSICNLLKKYWLKLLDLIDLEYNKKNHFIFYINIFLDGIAPQNFLTINPELIYSTIENLGKNLFNCIERFLTDLINNHGYFQVKTTDFTAFTVGKNLATTPGKVIFKNDLMELIRYTPTTNTVYQTPLLFIPPFINKYYILDLSENNSLVKWLVNQGIVVYMISWVNPQADLAHKKFSDYLIDGPLKAIDIITKLNLHPKVHLAGYCVGGTLLSCVLSYMQKNKDNRVLSATHFMSLVDFSNLGNIGALINESSLDLLELLINKKGYLDGRLLSMAFSALRPADLIWPYIINHYLLNKRLKALDILYWNSDLTNLPAKMYIFYLRTMCFQNKLMKPGSIKLNGVTINLNSIKVPIFCVAGDTDHITVWQSVYNGAKLYGGSVEFILSGSGHIKGIINPPADQKYSFRTNNDSTNINNLTPEQWLQGSIKHSGSWWPYWLKWIVKLNSKKIKVKNLQAKIRDLSNAPDAPGSYVLKRVTEI